MNIEKREIFLGTYFSKDIVLKLASTSRIFSWIVVGFYAVQWLAQIGGMLQQYLRGYLSGMGVMDIAQSILSQFEQPLRGLVYYIVLQGVAQALLMFMDMEDNTRRTARGIKG
jgi:hypothetical protein